MAGSFEDHWACETVVDGRWVLVDAQLDALQRDLLEVGFPIIDVPRDRFVVAGDAWRRHRAGEVDAERFGLTLLGEGGAWWIAGNLVRDAASLTGRAMLPWDLWGTVMDAPDEHVAFLDRLADLTLDPDAHRDELAALVAADDRVRVPDHVFNALRETDERVG